MMGCTDKSYEKAQDLRILVLFDLKVARRTLTSSNNFFLLMSRASLERLSGLEPLPIRLILLGDWGSSNDFSSIRPRKAYSPVKLTGLSLRSVLRLAHSVLTYVSF